MVVKAENLSCRRSGRQILEDLSFSAQSGEMWRVEGPNGVGKSTLLRILAGISQPSGGQLNIDRDQLVYAGHRDGIKAQLTVRENLQFWASVFQENSGDTAIAQADLEPLADRLAGHLSAGQKRRLGLARLFLSNRSIWILDEPTVSLDAAHATAFLTKIQAHCDRGGIVFLTSHIPVAAPNARRLDLTQFAPKTARNHDAFLEGDFT